MNLVGRSAGRRYPRKFRLRDSRGGEGNRRRHLAGAVRPQAQAASIRARASSASGLVALVAAQPDDDAVELADAAATRFASVVVGLVAVVGSSAGRSAPGVQQLQAPPLSIRGSSAAAVDPSGASADADTSIDVDVLRAELEAERSANAQLTERVRAIKEKQETMVVALEKKVGRLTQQLEANGTELQHQRQLNVDLTAINRKLSEAARTGLIDAETLNQSMETELAALRVARSAEMAEVEEIMAELRPLIGEVA